MFELDGSSETGTPNGGELQAGVKAQGKEDPKTTGRARVPPAIRVGLILGLVGAVLFTVYVVLITLANFVYDHTIPDNMYMAVITFPLIASILGLAGNITACSTVLHRAKGAVVLSLIVAFFAYVFLNTEINHLPQMVGAQITRIFPHICVSIVLWRKGWLPKVMAVVACVFGVTTITVSTINYLAYYAHTLGYAPPEWIWTVNTVVLDALYVLWCILWVDLNARPGHYLPLQEKYGEQEPPSVQAVRRRGRVLMGLAFGWLIGWLAFGVAPVASYVNTLVHSHGWALQEAVNRVLWLDSGGWLNVPVVLILLICAIVSLVQAKRFNIVAG